MGIYVEPINYQKKIKWFVFHINSSLTSRVERGLIIKLWRKISVFISKNKNNSSYNNCCTRSIILTSLIITQDSKSFPVAAHDDEDEINALLDSDEDTPRPSTRTAFGVGEELCGD